MRKAFSDPARATVGEAIFAMVDEGSGPPVVLVHGSLSDLRTWERQVGALAARFRVIAYSRRYAWPNDPIGAMDPDPIEAHVEDLAEVIRCRARGRAHVVGHSWGGLIGLMAALRHPDRVQSLVLMEPPALSLFMPLPPRLGPTLRLLATRPVVALLLLRFVRGGLVAARAAFRQGDSRGAIRALGGIVLGRDYFADLTDDRLGQISDNLGAERAQLLFTDFPVFDQAALARLGLPLLLIGGEDSPALFGATLGRIAELLPAVERATIPVASHIMHENNPAATSDAILSFLSRQG